MRILFYRIVGLQGLNLDERYRWDDSSNISECYFLKGDGRFVVRDTWKMGVFFHNGRVSNYVTFVE